MILPGHSVSIQQEVIYVTLSLNLFLVTSSTVLSIRPQNIHKKTSLLF